MGTLTLPRPHDRTPSLFDEPAGGLTLDDVIVARWEQISSGAGAPGPLCHGELRPVWAAGSRPVGGRCQDCGTRLS